MASRPTISTRCTCWPRFCIRAGRRDEAIVLGRKALNQRPNSIDALLTLGTVLAAAGRAAEAIARFEKALAIDPHHTQSLNLLGNLLLEESRFEEAVACYEKALAIDPNRADLENNLGSSLLASRRPRAAVEHYRRAQALVPNFAMAHFNEGTAHLLAADYPAGWQKCEWRWLVEEYRLARPTGQQPLWLGDADISGKTIVLWAEQGLGDTIQFARYVPLVAARGARVILAVQPPLLSLMKTLAGPAEVRTLNEEARRSTLIVLS